MSSIFTFNHSPPKPASPWSGTPSAGPTPSATPSNDPTVILDDIPGHLRASLNSGRVRNTHQYPHAGDTQLLDDRGVPISTLSSEPAIGSTEYKLSLSRGAKSEARLEQLTTQLLWRLQQSTAYHGTSTSVGGGHSPGMLLESHGALYEIGVADDGTLVGLSEAELDDSLDVLRLMAKKVGATVEVVRRVFVRTVTADDVERANQKRRDHIRAKLRAKGRNQQKMRMRDGRLEKVPSTADDERCEEELVKLDAHELEKFAIPVVGTKLWVAEALVRPGDANTPAAGSDDGVAGAKDGVAGESATDEAKPIHELRVSLTGPTTSGKSTLLGTLTSGELDNGRGKSRLSLLRHRHELISGITSSIAWEVFGYKASTHASGSEADEAASTEEDDNDPDYDTGFFGPSDPEPEDRTINLQQHETAAARLVNYATGNVSSWTDIHASVSNPLRIPATSEPSPGRIIFMSDSAGHSKYRHTTIRSLIGWAPHYIVLLIPANDADNNTNGADGLSDDLRRHLNLCLLLRTPLVVLFTKLDLAGKVGLKKVFTEVLSTLKREGRRPVVVKDATKVEETMDAIREDDMAVPIVFTSAMRGDGIAAVHEVLMRLPIPTHPRSAANGDAPATAGENKIDTLFHIEEFYDIKPIPLTSAVTAPSSSPTSLSASTPLPPSPAATEPAGAVISGHLKYGTISAGDILTIGPFFSSASSNTTAARKRSAGGAVSSADESHGSGSDNPSTTTIRGKTPPAGNDHQSEQPQWRTVQVVSIRHLRLPVAKLCAGEAGTIGVVTVPSPPPPPQKYLSPPSHLPTRDTDPLAREEDLTRPLEIRRGMVLLHAAAGAGQVLRARSGFTIFFPHDRSPAETQEGVAGEKEMEWKQGDVVQVYVASVRAAARVVTVEMHDTGVKVEVEFTRRHMRAWVEPGERVLVLLQSGGGQNGDAWGGVGRGFVCEDAAEGVNVVV